MKEKESNLSDTIYEDRWIHKNHIKEFIRQVEADFKLWKLKEFGINVCASPKFNKFIEKLRERAGKDLI